MKKLLCILFFVASPVYASEWDFHDIGVFYSHRQEHLPDFMKRLGRVMQNYTDSTGNEVCGMLSENRDGFAIRLSSDGVQLGCSLDKHEVVDGFNPTGLYVHSHPSGKNDGGRRVLHITQRDREWSKWRGERLGWHKALYLSAGFSSEDLRFGNGWLVERGRVYSHTNGRQHDHGPIADLY